MNLAFSISSGSLFISFSSICTNPWFTFSTENKNTDDDGMHMKGDEEEEKELKREEAEKNITNAQANIHLYHNPMNHQYIMFILKMGMRYQ